MTSIIVDDLSVRLGDALVLDGVNLNAPDRHIVGIVGPNGSGKTTLLRVMAGDIRPDGGSVTIGRSKVSETTIRRLAELRSFLGAEQPQNVLFPVRDLVTIGRHRVPAGAASAVLDATDTTHLEHRVFSSLSSGEQQRVGIARALAQRAAVVLLDEPTSALDIGHQEMVMGALRSHADDGHIVVAAIHDLNLAAAHADWLVLLDRGRIAASGSPDIVLEAKLLSDVYRQPVNVVRHPHRGCPLVLTLQRA